MSDETAKLELEIKRRQEEREARKREREEKLRQLEEEQKKLVARAISPPKNSVASVSSSTLTKEEEELDRKIWEGKWRTQPNNILTGKVGLIVSNF